VELFGIFVLLGSHWGRVDPDVQDELAMELIRDLSAFSAGDHHFERHLAPSFLYVIQKTLESALIVPKIQWNVLTIWPTRFEPSNKNTKHILRMLSFRLLKAATSYQV
jgi:hypothetical protein